ncbi:MAG: zinc-binding alcohol dehydrogenase [Chloroflexi bacterium]|nr:zinc-binding alcohol dehydrogenase [Chloroflexota bacterium]
MKSNSRRLVFPGPQEVAWEEHHVPLPQCGELSIETRRSLISIGTELAFFSGRQWTNPGTGILPKYPTYAGYSNAGIVVATGEATAPWKVGDRIASGARHATLQVVRNLDGAVSIPKSVSDEEATFCTLGATVLNAYRRGTPQLGECAVVVGQGILGQLAVQFLRLGGCEPVIAVDLEPSRLALTQKVGAATHLLNPSVDDVVGVVYDLTAGRGADIVFEATGLTETYDLTFALTRPHGRVVGLGSPRYPAPVDMQQVHIKPLQVIGAIGNHPSGESKENRWTRGAHAAYFMDLLEHDRVNVRDLITHRTPAADAPNLYPKLLADRTSYLGVVLEW